MFTITAASPAGRAVITRSGVRGSRVPQIVLGDGSTIKVMPGRSVRVTREVLESNLAVLRLYGEVVKISPAYSALAVPPVPESVDVVHPEEIVVDKVAVEVEASPAHVDPEAPTDEPPPVDPPAEDLEEVEEGESVTTEPKRRGRKRKGEA